MRRAEKEYPVLESELNSLRNAALLSLLIVFFPLLIIEVLAFVRRVKRETKFDES